MYTNAYICTCILGRFSTRRCITCNQQITFGALYHITYDTALHSLAPASHFMHTWPCYRTKRVRTPKTCKEAGNAAALELAKARVGLELFRVWREGIFVQSGVLNGCRGGIKASGIERLGITYFHVSVEGDPFRRREGLTFPSG